VDVAAVLVNYNAGDELRGALQSIVHELDGRDWEAIVVDNASEDGSGGIAAEFGPRARLLHNAQNVGFGRGVNQGIAASTAPLVLVMNPDCRLLDGAMPALEAELRGHAGCAIVGPRILDPDGSEQGSARGDPDMFTGLFGRTTWLRGLLPHLPISRRNVVTNPGIDDPSMPVDWVSGACVLLRRDAFDAVRGFDERYFLYWEDADLCRRLRGAGYQVRYVPGASAVHRVGHSSRRVRASAIRAFHESAYLYYSTYNARGALAKRLVARALLAARCRWLLLLRSDVN
jgi:N-acetylglucosaminyl-diphospho-decaprenol L-rhamnosyltransferase